MKRLIPSLALTALVAALAIPDASASEEKICTGFGPQTPRDIGIKAGLNPRLFSLAPPPSALNLCNIHTHTNAEHRGPGFYLSAGEGEYGGYQCNDSGALTTQELTDPGNGHGAFGHVKPGDTIEVHWVYTSCDIQPGPGLGSCLTESCANPELRVEAQVFLVVNDPKAIDFTTMTYDGHMANGYHQPKALPEGTGMPVVFRGSTTGHSYSQEKCSPLQVTWSVRPDCARLDIGSLNRWAEQGNVFKEVKSHGVRHLVKAPELLSKID